MSPLISVLLPTFNGAEFLSETIDSILAQDIDSLELIVVDDGSRDDTVSIVKSYGQANIRLHVFPDNQGVSVARNKCLDMAKGEFVAFTAQDDLSQISRCRLQLNFLEDYPNVAFVGSNVRFIDKEGQYLSESIMPASDIQMRWQALFDAPARHSTLMIRSSFIDRNQLKYDPSFKVASDTNFILKMLRAGVGANLQHTLVSYRLHETNASKVHRNLYHKNGDILASAWIKDMLPEFSCSEEEISNLRRMLFMNGASDRRLRIQNIKRATSLYLELQEQFEKKYGEHISLNLDERRPEIKPF